MLFRRLLPPGAGLAALLVTAGLIPAQAAQAAADGWPVGDWTVCADDAARSCIETATLTPVDGVPTDLVEFGLTASATSKPTEPASLGWAVAGWADQPADVLGGDVTLVIRTGQYVPRFTTAVAEGLRVTRTVDEADDWTMTVTGHAVHVDWITTGEFLELCDTRQHCGEADQMADEEGTGYRFSGTTQDLEGAGGQDYLAAIDGAYIASDGQARTESVSYDTGDDPYLWFGVLGNPHLDVNGNPVRGSFNAWIPAGYFGLLGTTPEAALGGGFDLVDVSRGEPVSLPVSATAVDGGVGFAASDVGYGMNYLHVYHRPSGAPDGVTVPGVPRDVEGTADSGMITAQWSAPESDGGRPVTGYTVRAFTEASGGTIAGRCEVSAGDDATSCTVENLVEDEIYHLAVSATNVLGEGPAPAERLQLAAGAPQASPPSAPLELKVTPGAARLTATWSLPESDNGAPITGYTVRAFTTVHGLNPVATCTAVAPARTCALTKLTNGVAYHVGVTATNDVGEGPESEVRVAGVPRTVATAPRSVVATSTGGKVRVTWSVPASTGGAAVTGYRVAAYAAKSGGSAVAECSTKVGVRTCTLTGLRAGRTYYVGTTAQNAAGRSPESPRVRILVRR